MDTDPELTTRAPAARQPRQARRGIAMVTAIFALVIVGVLVAGMYNLASLQARAVKNRTAATRALLLAEAGAAHAVMLVRDTLKKKSNTAFLRGSDGITPSADDSVLIGFGLSSGVQIPRAGYATSEGRYWVKFRDDDDGDSDPFRDSNMRIIAQCTAATPDSGYAAVDIVISGVSQMPGFFSNGNLAVGGSTIMKGPCGDIHANGNMTFANPGATISGDASATGSITNGGVVKDTLGAANPTLASQAPLDVPPLPYSTFCPGKASYVLRSNGQLWRHTVNPAVSIALPSGLSRTMSGSAVIWSATGTAMNAIPGVICVEGNFALSGNSGTAASPLPLTIVATHSVQVSGTPYLRPATTDSITIVAGGDVSIAGNPSGGAYSYEGLIYANSQCVVTGNAKVNGNVVCRNATHTAAAMDYAGASNSMGGSTELHYGCGGYFNQPRRILQWVQLVR